MDNSKKPKTFLIKNPIDYAAQRVFWIDFLKSENKDAELGEEIYNDILRQVGEPNEVFQRYDYCHRQVKRMNNELKLRTRLYIEDDGDNALFVFKPIHHNFALKFYVEFKSIYGDVEKMRIARIATKVAKTIIADTTLAKYKETQNKLEELKKEKEKYDKKISDAWETVKSFEEKVYFDKIKISDVKKKKALLKWCKNPKSVSSDFFKEYFDEGDTSSADKLYNASFVIYYHSKEPAKLQKKIDEYETKLSYMKKDLDNALKLRDNLPPEFEKALQNVYNIILKDCEFRKIENIAYWEKCVDNAWDIMTNPQNPYYRKYIGHFGVSYYCQEGINRFDVFPKDSKSPEEFKKKVMDAAKKYIDELTKLDGKPNELIEYIESHPKLGIKGMYDYKKPENSGNAKKAINVVEQNAKWMIKDICDGDSISTSYLNKYKGFFEKNLEKAKKHSAEKEAMMFYEAMKDRFVDDLSKYCSQIVEVQNAKIGIKGNIDAIVIAPNGIFNVKAVPAGGYNIQRYHYRVLIKKINKV